MRERSLQDTIATLTEQLSEAQSALDADRRRLAQRSVSARNRLRMSIDQSVNELRAGLTRLGWSAGQLPSPPSASKPSADAPTDSDDGDADGDGDGVADSAEDKSVVHRLRAAVSAMLEVATRYRGTESQLAEVCSRLYRRRIGPERSPL